MKQAVYEVVWPLGKSACEVVPRAANALDLSGKTVCELWDQLFRGAEIFPLLRELLGGKYPGIKFVDYNVFGDIHGPKETEVIAALPGKLREHKCDVVIAGVGA